MIISKDKLFLKVKDNTVSNEEFDLMLSSDWDLLVTSPQPDENNLSRYYESEDYISHTDGKRSLFEKAYHFIKRIAIQNKVKLINTINGGPGKILDIGAGTGDFLLASKDNGWQVSGSEPSSKARVISAKKSLIIDQNTSKFGDESFDIITMWHVLEHIPNLDVQIFELKRLLKKDGTIVIAVPNFKSYDAAHYGAFWAGYDVPRHLWHFSKTAIRLLFDQHNMVLKRVIPLKFDAFYVSLLSEKYKTGKMNPLNAFLVGLKSNFKGAKTMNYSSHIYVLTNK